uniref:Pyrin domain-containing protein n=1 Tax=Poecilia reticulata TaxID=8081 RepID=A0A3P9N2L5_POERE
MAPKTAKKILKDILENLSEEDLDKFRSELLNRRVVKTSQVQKKGFLVITDVMVQAYTEKNVLKEAEDILRENNCEQAADELGKYLHDPSSSSSGSSSGSGWRLALLLYFI